MRFKRRRLAEWQEAAAACHMNVRKAVSPWLQPVQLEGRSGRVEVRMESPYRHSPIDIVATAPWPGGFAKISIRYALRSSTTWPRDLESGDETFDAEFDLGGPPRLLRALLDARTRGLLTRVNVESLLEIAGSEVRAKMVDSQLVDLLPLVVELCRRCARPMDLARRLVEIVERDPQPGVRLHCLRVLLHEFASDARIVDALRAGARDPDPRIRLEAAIALHGKGQAVLEQLAEGLEDDACSARAVAALGGWLPQERATAILHRALDGRRVQTARACLELLGAGGGDAAVETLAEVLVREQGELAAVAARALGTAGGQAAEPHLIAALERDQMDLQTAAADALARVGSVAAVPPLKDLAEHLARGPHLRRAARQAIAEIQSRVAGASPGQLSLTGDEAGRLSLARSDAGQLSLADDAAGQLSLTGEVSGEEKGQA